MHFTDDFRAATLFYILIYEWWDLRVYGKMVLFTKTPWVNHEDCKQVRAVRSWHSHPGSLTAFVWQRAETEEMWEAGTDVFFNDPFCMIYESFFMCVLYVFCVHAVYVYACSLKFKEWLLYHVFIFLVFENEKMKAFCCHPAQLNPLVPLHACYYCCISMLMEAFFFFYVI